MVWWAFNVEQDRIQWLREHPGHTAGDVAAIEDCVRRARACSYWEWHRGSRIMWFRLPEEWQPLFRDGPRLFHLGRHPKGMTRDATSESRAAEIAVRKKIFRLGFRGYSERGGVDLVQGRFSVIKLMEGEEVLDIRVVFDSKSNGYNENIWAPGFALPTWADAQNMVCKWLSMPVGEYLSLGSPSQDYTGATERIRFSDQGDIDVGEMFHNFMVHVSERHALGVRHVLTDSRPGAEEDTEFRRFARLHFGSRASPYLAYQGQIILLDICKGDRRNEMNPFHWSRIHCNLPGALDYDTSMPRVMMLRGDEELACREATFVDDIHVAGRMVNKVSLTRLACKRLKARMNHLGNQADDRKYRDVTTTPGPWIGGIMHTDTPFPMQSTTGKKWSKFRAGLHWVIQQSEDCEEISTGSMRQIAGLGVNVTEIYPEGRPYLKGFFNALESWRGWRDVDGWKLQQTMDSLRDLEARGATREECQEAYPEHVRITDELVMHVKGLLKLFGSEEPRAVPVRPTDRGKVRYHAGDASAEGYAAGTQYPDLSFEGRDGLWRKDFAAGGSNLREAQNIVNHLLLEVREGKHDGCEVWSATDNAV